MMHDVDPPAISLQLTHDTGRDDTDSITSDPTIQGRVEDASQITLLRTALDGGPWLGVLPMLNGVALPFDQLLLEQLHGQPLEDGIHVLSVQAADAQGQLSDATAWTFYLDRTAPPSSIAPDLLGSSDSGPSSFDNITQVASPLIRMFAQRGSRVDFYAGDVLVGQTISAGVAEFQSVSLPDGQHVFTAVMEDLASNTSGRSQPLVVTIDTVAPQSFSAELDAASRSAVDPSSTTSEFVTVVGQTEGGAHVGGSLRDPQQVGGSSRDPQQVGGSSRDPQRDNADSTAVRVSERPAHVDGSFTLTDIPLAVGENHLVIVAHDLAGNQIETTLVITRASCCRRSSKPDSPPT